MKTLLIISLAIFSNLFPQPDQAPVALDDVCRAIGSGNVEDLAAVMDAEVELSILDKEDLYSRDQAVSELKTFFATNTPSSFGKVHQGASKSADAEYCIGTLATAKGPFRVYVYVAKKGSGVLLQELRFERE
ncbi:DUF4783 domain-containing protein [Neolewinella aurantiaca]|uniref:DUF4783 domain-containing protein n=1 Tax=Neolewinella aurantiaca TaxID=2602767 RepID=A0A5C7FWE1_9BACT|nr:DUF4783 domain-containing protein [Neolewinella aurantiaca]TXF90985.1 DUF4783 domain-containing protein [Neolewinella aurantiaca]